MLSPLALEFFAADFLRDRHAAAAHHALIAQLPHASSPRPDLAIRLRVARGLRALALRLDPGTVVVKPSFAALHAR